MAKTLKKGLILSIGLIICFSLQLFADNIYVYKNSSGSVYFTNTKPLNIDKRYKKVKVIKILNVVKSEDSSYYKSYSRYSKYKIDNLLKKAAQTYNLDYNLLKAVAVTESDLNHNVRSNKGAIGVMQLMPETARRFGVKNLNSLEENIQGGARYLKFLLKEFGGNAKLALAAYNAGENSIRKYNGVPPFPETLRYLRKVFALYKKFLNNEKYF